MALFIQQPNSYPAASAVNVITPMTNAIVPLRLRQHSGSQSANLLTLEKNDGTLLTSFSATSALLTLGNGIDTAIGELALNGSANTRIDFQIASVNQWQMSAIANTFVIADSPHSRSQLQILGGTAGNAYAIFLDQLRVQLGAGQSAAAFDVKASDGTTSLFSVDVSGNLLFGTTNTKDVGSTASKPRDVYSGRQFLAADGSAGVPSVSFSSIPTSGFCVSGGVPAVSVNNGIRVLFQQGSLQIATGNSLNWSGTTYLFEDAANVLALRNGANAQSLNLYETYTDASNYSRLTFNYSSAYFQIGADRAGTGTYRGVILGGSNFAFATGGTSFASNTTRWQFTSSGHLQAWAASSYDIGALTDSGNANAPRSIYARTSVVAPVFTANVGGSTGTMNGIGAANIQTSSAGVGNGADTTDDTLFTYTLPINALSAAGKSLRVRAWGTFAADANTKTVKLWFAGTALVNSGVLTLSGKNWTIEYEVTAIDSTHVSTTGSFMGDTASVQDVAVNANLVVSDLTVNTSIIKVTGASTITGAASDVLGYGMKVWFEN